MAESIRLEDVTTVELAYAYAKQELSGVDPAEIDAHLPLEAEALGYDPTTPEGALVGAEVLVFG